MSWPGTLALLLLLPLLLYGAFSRFTHGRHTPSFYAYQVARAPDDGSAPARLLPCADLVLAGMLAHAPTRGVAAAVVALAQFGGVVVRVRRDQDAAPDLAILLCAVLLALDTVMGG